MVWVDNCTILPPQCRADALSVHHRRSLAAMLARLLFFVNISMIMESLLVQTFKQLLSHFIIFLWYLLCARVLKCFNCSIKVNFSRLTVFCTYKGSIKSSFFFTNVSSVFDVFLSDFHNGNFSQWKLVSN